MPQILINTNDIALEEIERMQNEKDEKFILKELRTGKHVISVSGSVQKEIKRIFESGD